MNESEFSRELRKSLEAELKKSYARKIMPGSYMSHGTSDIYACLFGLFVGLEDKILKDIPKRPDTLVLKKAFNDEQVTNIRLINEAGGLGLGVVCIWPWKTAIMLRYNDVLEVNEGVTSKKLRAYMSVWAYKCLDRRQGAWVVRPIVDEARRRLLEVAKSLEINND